MLFRICTRFFDGGRLHHDLLEATFQGAIFFDVLTVFIQGCGSNALDFATCKGRLEHVGSVQRAACTASTNNRVDFVDEQDDVRRFLQLVHHGLHSLLELPAVLGPCNQAKRRQG